ncbi:Glutamate-gated chloride channel [Armadillidium vulgare]|nr:Glutamate-gated chloride channel [Armadillidium vulgare]
MVIFCKEFKVQVTLRCFWQDERLQFSNQSGNLPYVTLITPSNVWVPDLFFRNEKEGEFHNILLPNTYLRIYPDGNVSIDKFCHPDFVHELPTLSLDVQKCQLPLASCLSLTSRNLVLSWKNGEPLQITNVLLLKVFILQNAIDVWTGVCLTFVFGVLLEIALISHFLSLERNNESKNKVSEEEEEEKAGDNAIEY